MTSTSSKVVEATTPEEPQPTLSKRQPLLSPEVSSYFIAGGIAGAASRTVVSPLERLKILQQVQKRSADQQYQGVWRSLVRIWNEEGFKGFMRGNGINCIRIVPYSAVQFTSYEQLKKWVKRHGTGELDTPKRLVCGALAGITSVCTTYPLDLVRSRLSIATASLPLNAQQQMQAAKPSAMSTARQALASAYHTSSSVSSATTSTRPAYTPQDLTVWGMTLKVMREEGGVRALYRGLVATAMGVAPYVGINFAAYEAFRGIITPPGQNTVPRKLLCGALAGSISQTLTYPFDCVRRKMQVTGMGGGVLGYQYTGALSAFSSIIKNEGFLGLYQGIWPNLLKVAPSIATSFFTYELVKELLV